MSLSSSLRSWSILQESCSQLCKSNGVRLTSSNLSIQVVPQVLNRGWVGVLWQQVQWVDTVVSTLRKRSTNEVIFEYQTPPKAPDGGWGWLVTFSSFVVSMFVDRLSFTFGIFFPEFLRYFGESKGKTQLLHSVMWGTFFVIGPVASVLVNMFGNRLVAGSGALIMSVGIFLSSFAPNLNVMIFLYSIVGGIGYGLIYQPSIVILGVYFEKRRALATGIAVCGAGVGGFVFAPLCEFLLELYDWQGTMRIISAILLHGLVVSATYRPLRTAVKTKSTCIKNDEKSENSEICCKHLSLNNTNMFDFTLFKSPTMLLYGTTCFLVMFGLFVPSNFLPALASDVHLSTKEGTYLILIMGVANTMTRVVVGYITDKSWANSLMINCTALLLGGVSTCFVPFYDGFNILAIYSFVFGAVIAVFICLRSLLMAELLGVHRLNNSFGIVGLSMGLSTYLGSPIAGALADASGNYNMTFYFAGITLVLGGLICLPLRRISEREKRRSVDFNTNAMHRDKESEDNTTIKTHSSNKIPRVYTISEDF
ncbi:monocarboxylate transporter 12-like [Ylistrum balloti]|uniref:monocarboxylate transporter 12-like n=1 Tax=Ylistrum balloti TaxID=509963 RepID=UPI002905C6E2|nr:monocarboxylate transporter 12-like [Ylistrum balloti]